MPQRLHGVITLIVFGTVLFLALSCVRIHFAPPITKNLYAGTTTPDATGAATIDVPNAVIRANSSFSYQVKSMGNPMPSLYVKSSLQNSHFESAGEHPMA
jgi:hypothetical protein